MLRTLYVACCVAVLCLQFIAATPAAAQRSASTCSLETMPPLPADANTIPTQTKSGFIFEPGAYRCSNRSWEYIPGHWERARRNALPNPMTMIEVRQGRVHARSGYEFVPQGDSTSGQAILRQAGRGPGGALSVVTVTVSCSCAFLGSCPIRTSGTAVTCDNANCTKGCSMSTVISGSGGVLSKRRNILGTVPCGQPGGVGHAELSEKQSTLQTAS